MRYERYTHKRQYKRYERHTAQVIEPLSFQTNLPKTKATTVGEEVALKVVVIGGKIPYKYLWKKGDSSLPTSGDSHTIASSTEADSGSYSCTVTDSLGQTLKSNDCVLTVTAPVVS
ncbi:decoration protein [Salmonella phage STP-SP5]|nr:decoration protein [Salmonella phage STP-SP5]